MIKSLAQSSLLRLAACFLGVCLVVFQVSALIPLVWSKAWVMRDLQCYLTAAQNLVAHRSIYDAPRVYYPDLVPRWYLYPPQLALIMAPLAHASYVTVFRVWYVAEFLCYWTYAAMLARIVMGRWVLDKTLMAGVALWLTPFMGTIIVAENIDTFLWVLYGLGFLLPARGVFWSLIAQFKPFTVPALLVACFAEGRRVWLPAGIMMATGYGMALALCGPHEFRTWITLTPSIVGQGTTWESNLSPVFALARLAAVSGHLDFSRPLSPDVRHLFTAVQALAIGAAIFKTRRMPVEYRYAIVTAATLLSSPICWANYVPMLLMVPALYLRDARSRATDDVLEPHAGLKTAR